MNKKRIIQLLSFLLCLTLFVGLMPLNTFAAEEEFISSVSATITLPTAGSHPVETGTPGDSSYTIAWVSFYDSDDLLDASATFEAGKTYMIFVAFLPNIGCTIDQTTTATINGMNAEYWNSMGSGANQKFSFCVTYTVPEEITNISVTVPEPVAGGTADTRGITINPTNFSINSAEWCALKDGVGLVSVSKFSAGKTYYLVIKYDVAAGYEVSKNAEISHNLTEGAVAHDSSKKTIMIEYTVVEKTPITYTVCFEANGGTGTMADVTGVSGEYTLPECGFTPPQGKRYKGWSVNGTEKAAGEKIIVAANTNVTALWEEIPTEDDSDLSISSVKVSDVTEPVMGATPDYNITVTGALPNEDEYENGLVWRKYNSKTNSWKVVNADTPFGEGLYALEVFLVTQEGTRFTKDTKVYYNDVQLPEWHDTYESCYEWWADRCIDVRLYFTLGEPVELEKITSVCATVTVPVAGESPSFEAIVGGENYTAELEWEIVEEEVVIYPEDNHKFVAGEKYGLWVAFIAEDGYEFAEDVTISINGITPEISYMLEDVLVGFVPYTVSNVPDTPVDPVILGDVNKDTKIDAKDALMVLKIAVNKLEATTQQRVAADVNKDTKVDAKDALEILKYAVKKPSVLG